MLTQTMSRPGSFNQPMMALRQAAHASKNPHSDAPDLMGALVPFADVG
jgi:hypothetical protein